MMEKKTGKVWCRVVQKPVECSTSEHVRNAANIGIMCEVCAKYCGRHI